MSSGLLEDASFNQSPAFGDVDLFSADRPLVEAATRAGLDLADLADCGRDYGAATTLDLGPLIRRHGSDDLDQPLHLGLPESQLSITDNR